MQKFAEPPMNGMKAAAGKNTSGGKKMDQERNV